MWPAAGSAGRVAVGAMIAGALALLTACTGGPRPPAAPRPSSPATAASATSPARPSASTRRPTAAASVVGRYQVGERRLTFTEPIRDGPAGRRLGPRTLATTVRYPRFGSGPAAGPRPLLVFAPGFMQCSGPYSALLDAWASAGYVVAAVDFPRTSCHEGAAAYEPDLVNQPRDVTYAITRLLTLNARPHDLFSGLLDRREIGAVGQSDGGDTVAALAANGCCIDSRLAAVAVLSGAEWPPMPGRYFPRGRRTPPMLFVQGSSDMVNPPWTSVQLYRTDRSRARYYLDLLGADHMSPYTGPNATERLVVRVTLAFFDRYLRGQAGALDTMTRAGNVRGTAILVGGGQPPP
jgi:dienelactone hydrolase